MEGNERGSTEQDTGVDVAQLEVTRTVEILTGIRSLQEQNDFARQFVTASVSKINEAERTVELTFASEYPVFRRDLNAFEVLEMSETAANLTRLNSAGPLLWNHNRDDQIGGIVKAWIGADRRAHAVVKFSSSQRGTDFFRDVVDGIRKNVSFHYRIYDGKVKAATRGSNKPDTFTATSWEATEISLVSVPADPTVGVGRDAEGAESDRSDDTPSNEIVEAERSEGSQIEPAQTAPATTLERGSMERKDIENAILEMGKRFGAEELARTFALDETKTVEDFRKALIDKSKEAQRTIVEGTPGTGESINLDLSPKDVKSYSMLRALQGLISGKRDGFEFECSRELEKRIGRPTDQNGVFVPVDVQRSQIKSIDSQVVAAMRAIFAGQRDLSATLGSQPTDGGALVGTDHMASAFIDVLRSEMKVMALGARMLTGLVGNVAIPRQNGTAQTYWVTEGVAPTESQQTFGQLPLSPKTVGAVTEFTRQLLLQSSPSVEQLVMADLAAVMARAIDKAAINGSGSDGEPTGVLNTTGVSEYTSTGTAGAFIYPDAVGMETALLEADVRTATCAFLSRPSVRGTLKTRPKIEGSTFPVFMIGEDNRLNGYRHEVSTQVPNGTTLIFGDWSQIIVAEWGVLELVANTLGSTFRAGGVEVRALQSVDIAVRYAQAFKKETAFA